MCPSFSALLLLLSLNFLSVWSETLHFYNGSLLNVVAADRITTVIESNHVCGASFLGNSPFTRRCEIDRALLHQVKHEVDLQHSVSVIFYPLNPSCDGSHGLWHIFVECFNVVIEGIRDALKGDFPGSQQPSALIFFDPKDGAKSDASDCNTISPMQEKWTPLIREFFTVGIFKNPTCFWTVLKTNSLPVHQVNFRTAVLYPSPEEKRQLLLASPELIAEYRIRGFRAFNIPEPSSYKWPQQSIPMQVAHLLRGDNTTRTTNNARTLQDDSLLEKAFRELGTVSFVRCCKWKEKSSVVTAIKTVSTSDVIISMHGAALTNTYWSKPGAVIVDLFPANGAHGSILDKWFYKYHAFNATYIAVKLKLTASNHQSAIDYQMAKRITQCVLKSRSSVPPHAPAVCVEGGNLLDMDHYKPSED